MSEATPGGAVYEPFPPFEVFEQTEVDLTSYASTAETLEGLKRVVGPNDLKRAVDTATRWAAVDTGAIEGLYTVDRGFTMSVAASAAALDNAHLVVGEKVVRAIQDAIAGYDFVLDVATSEREASENWIRELHAVLCASQETYQVMTSNGPEERPLVKGAYKELPNNPVNLETGRVHAYAAPFETAAEMRRLIDELTSERFKAAHPVLQAAYAHYAFVCVHPFPDGNGRVARALASTYLYRHPGVPLVVFADQKGTYIDALEGADAGDMRPLVTFLRERTIDTMLMVITTMDRPAHPDPAERIAHLNKVMRSDSGLMHTEIDSLLSRVSSAWNESLDRAAMRLTPPISHQRHNATGRVSAEGYRHVEGLPRTQISVRSAAPATGETFRLYSYGIARPGVSEADFAIFEEASPRNHTLRKVIDVYLRDVHPTVSPALQYRLDTLADDLVSEMVSFVVDAGVESLRKAGYIV